MVVSVEFDRPRNLRYDIQAIRDLEAQLDNQPLGVVVRNLSQMGINTLVAALWAGLKHEDRGLTPNLVSKMLERYLQEKKSLKTLMQAVSEAIDQSGLFQAEEPEGNATTEPAATTSHES